MKTYSHVCGCGCADCEEVIELSEEDSDFVFKNNYVIIAEGCPVPEGCGFIKKLENCSVYCDPRRG